MSMYGTEPIYGYGINSETVLKEIPDENYLNFIRNHTPDYAKDLSDEELEEKIIEDSKGESGDYAIYERFCAIMSDETQLDRLQAHFDSENDVIYIMFVEGMPWSYDDKNLLNTEDDAKNILVKYLKELTDDSTLFQHITYQACSY